MLSRIAKVTETLVLLDAEYPFLARARYGKWPEDVLPYSRTLTQKLLEDELIDPAAGAALRSMSVERWQGTVRRLEMMLTTCFLPRELWLRWQAVIDKAVAISEQLLIERDQDSLEAEADSTERPE
jgi:hypothetical protein